jgi:hypothetical protein
MKRWHCFNGQSEYDSFLAWAIEGSCLEQRMQTSSGGVFDIPDYWFYWREAKKLGNKTKLDEESRKLPYRLNKYAEVVDVPSAEYPEYPNE